MAERTEILRFEDFELDPDAGELRRAGAPVALEPQTFDLIACLARNAGRIVSRDDLIKQVWEGRIVSDAAISTRINAARAALGDDGRQQRLIKTVTRRGFRFAADVVEHQEPAGAATATARGATLLPPADRPSIAVLPFVNMSADPDQEFLADGLAQDIITALSNISEMFVISRNSSFAYKGQTPDARQVAAELGVRTILEGSLRRAGSRVRITAQLVNAADGSHLWAEKFDREIADLFDLQDEITKEIVTALQVKLTHGEQARLWRRQTSDMRAWDLYVRAQSQLRLFTREGNNGAREMLREALELDPRFAAAWSLLAWTHLMDSRGGWAASGAQALAEGVVACEQALSLHENQPDALAMFGHLKLLQGHYDEGDAILRKAIDLSPSMADHYVMRAVGLNMMWRGEEALTCMRTAMRLCPVHPGFYLGILAQAYWVLGRHEEAIEADMERLARFPENPFSDLRLAAVYADIDDIDKASAHMRQALRKNPSYSARSVRQTDPYRAPEHMERYLALLRRAGLPEG